MFFKKKEVPVQYTIEQAIRMTAKEMPAKLADSIAVIVGNYDEYSRRNQKCNEAIKVGDRNTYDQYDFLRRNSLCLAVNEIKKISDYLTKRYNVSAEIDETSPESMIDTIANFCGMYYQTESQEVACFR